MSEKMEQVARAICLASHIDNGHTPDSAASLVERGSWHDYVTEARAAIAAMREPTGEMWKAEQPIWSLGRPMWDWWRSMIDEILK